ncbi:DNA gyrase C-terminal beta-propeller domain-containing protein [Mesomycoplasma hyopneumoniae]|uniref:DNA gyrase C-terminal beta-propeller domain-containing protein n=1 Tax=Mesomycoplasma hyopneumoniae TaxID=2099 RepID=UPI0028063CED
MFIGTIGPDQEAIIITKRGFAIRIDLDSVPIIIPRTKGVKLIKLKDEDEISFVTLIKKRDKLVNQF